MYLGGKFKGIFKINSTYTTCTNEVLIYSLQTKKWENVNCPREDLNPRYNHASCIMGKFILIHGG